MSVKSQEPPSHKVHLHQHDFPPNEISSRGVFPTVAVRDTAELVRQSQILIEAPLTASATSTTNLEETPSLDLPLSLKQVKELVGIFGDTGSASFPALSILIIDVVQSLTFALT